MRKIKMKLEVLFLPFAHSDSNASGLTDLTDTEATYSQASRVSFMVQSGAE